MSKSIYRKSFLRNLIEAYAFLAILALPCPVFSGAAPQSIKENDFRGVIFPANYKLHGYGPEKRWEPQKEDIEKIEKVLPDCLKDYALKNKSYHHSNLIYPQIKKYIRQYFGVINGQKEQIIWINLFMESSSHAKSRSWEQDLLLVLDGGANYFNLNINPATGACTDISVNGEA
jgi:hypothetical protein